MSVYNQQVRGLRIKQGGITIVSAATEIDFEGAGVAVAQSAPGAAQVTVAGAATPATEVRNEHPTDNGNGTYTLTHSPVSGSVQVYKNGIRLNPGAGNDYTISGSVITLLVDYDSSAVITADYLY